MAYPTTIRCYCDDDFAEVVDIEQQVFDFPQSPAQILPLLGDIKHCLIVELDQQVIGFAFARALVDEAELLNVALLPDYRGTGLVDQLLEHLFMLLHKNNIDSVYLEVRESNLRAINCYQRLGFVQTGLRKSYYPTNIQGIKEAALLMRKDL